MNYAALFGSALWALLRHKLRSLLTVLGITIGIGAVICVVAIGKAGQAQVEQQLNNLGDNFVWVEAGGRAINGVRTGTHGTKTLTLGDAAAIKSQIPLIKSVSPQVDASVQIIYGNQNWFTTYRGVSPEYFDIKRWYTDQGAVFTPDDVERAADVCVIGRTVRDQLFGALDPIGKVIRVRDMPCKVIATLRPKGLAISGQDQDDAIMLPYTTAQKKLKGISWLDDVLCSAVSPGVVKLAGQQAAALLRDRHHLRPEEDDDFNIRNPEDIIQAQLDASRTLSARLIAVASVSLVVGRTLGWPMQMSPEAVLVAALFSIAVGVFFGYYPARKASLLDPIEALRYE